jgi:hypothetical protein
LQLHWIQRYLLAVEKEIGSEEMIPRPSFIVMT